MEFKPIGYFHSDLKHTYETPRQGILEVKNPSEETSYILLDSKNNFEQALLGLNQFSHVWILFHFHQNTSWKPMVQPPRGSDKKLGVFATRSPYRPNPIGMTAAELIKIEGLKVYVAGTDLIHATPILDIKPYIPYSDSLLNAGSGWLENSKKYTISFSELAQEQNQFLMIQNQNGLFHFIHSQLEFEPDNSKTKRIIHAENNLFIIAYRTWRIEYTVSEEKVLIKKIYSGYTDQDLASLLDPYKDKNLHIEFNKKFLFST